MFGALYTLAHAVRSGHEAARLVHDWRRGRSCDLVYSDRSWRVRCNIHELAKIMTRAQRANTFVTLIPGKLCVNPHQLQMIEGKSYGAIEGQRRTRLSRKGRF